MYLSSSLLAAALVLGRVADAAQNQLTKVSGFTAGPTKAGMYIYLPTKKLSPAPIIVAIHYCTGTAQAYFTGSKYATLADTKGFIVIYPNSPSSGGCWDVASKTSLTHDAGGDSKTIANMVDYAVKNYGGDRDRVFATGSRCVA
jgi:acetylxylan esterase